MASVLVVEDDQRIRESLARGLPESGHAVRLESSGAAALTALMEWTPDIVVLDLGLPDIDGTDVLQMIRGISPVPIIVATARDDEQDMIRVLDRGADDYVVKPYSLQQLDARIRAVLRRTSTNAAATETMRIGDVEIDTRRRVATLRDIPLELSRLEFDLLSLLATRSPEVVTRREILAEVWRQPYGGAEKTVDVHISWLRRKLGETADSPRYLHTVRGVGVKLEITSD